MKQQYQITHNISIIDLGTLECAENQNSNKQCIILNFANAFYPGGSYCHGFFGAQEEAICSRTNIYQTLTQSKCINEYYNYNKQDCDQLTANGCIFTKNYIIRSNNYEILQQYERIDTVSCAAIDRRYVFNDIQADEATNIKIQNIYTTINLNSDPEQIVILGAFGCGVFKNDPNVMSRLLLQNLKYLKNKNVIFAIPNKQSQNYQIFYQQIQKYCKQKQ